MGRKTKDVQKTVKLTENKYLEGNSYLKRGKWQAATQANALRRWLN